MGKEARRLSGSGGERIGAWRKYREGNGLARRMATAIAGGVGHGNENLIVNLCEDKPILTGETTGRTGAPEPVADVPQETGPRVGTIQDVVSLAELHRDLAFKVLLKRCVRPVKIEQNKMEVSFTDDAPPTLATDLTTRLRKWTGRNWFVSVSKREGGKTLSEIETARREDAFMDARSDPTVAEILARFPGAKITDVRIAVSEDEVAEAEMTTDTTDTPGLDPIEADDDDND